MVDLNEFKMEYNFEVANALEFGLTICLILNVSAFISRLVDQTFDKYKKPHKM